MSLYKLMGVVPVCSHYTFDGHDGDHNFQTLMCWNADVQFSVKVFGKIGEVQIYLDMGVNLLPHWVNSKPKQIFYVDDFPNLPVTSSDPIFANN